ncbi:hypothetical protein SLEP1_g58273 [Rubroshorea leprosula]|uniref:Uncharacterized protein n=1 Tax=Rubroshorea leprosula TaxID=152421 RepID=A0AAV5MSU6_9ROSI|nr:hypothetical protein SLEP1_g58273 [Rubroshorea leprosula]
MRNLQLIQWHEDSRESSGVEVKHWKRCAVLCFEMLWRVITFYTCCPVFWIRRFGKAHRRNLIGPRVRPGGVYWTGRNGTNSEERAFKFGRKKEGPFLLGFKISRPDSALLTGT